MLDSLEAIIPYQPVGVMNKFFLVRLRVQDKAYITHQSDLMTKKLLDYYENKGTDSEKQEVYFYAGSVYRDLHDTPMSMEYFLKSVEIAEEKPSLDSVMLKNAYSNLFYLFYDVQDYANAYKYALSEYNISKKLNKTELTCLMHLGMSLSALDSLKRARDVYAYTLDTISSTPQLIGNTEILSSLLSEFSYLKDTANASKSFRLLSKNHVDNEDDGKCFAFGEYYNLIGKKDSAIYYYNAILQNKTDLYRMYDASKAIFYIFDQARQIEYAEKYARLYIQISDSIDLGKRQELTATVNNEFQYHRDKNREQEMVNEKESYRSFAIISIITIIAIILLAVTIIVYRRNLNLKALLSLSDELNKQINEKKQLQVDIEKKEKELNDSRTHLSKSEHELEDVKEQLKLQNQTFLNLLHQSELEGSAEDVVYAIRQSSGGTKNMTAADWKQLYKAIDELYPSFYDQLLKELGTFTEQQMQVCYLMRIGLNKTQIQNMTNLSRVTVWRWTKKYAWIQALDMPQDK